MNYKQVLEDANKLFLENNIENYFYETRELLSFVLNKSKEWIMMNLYEELSFEDKIKFDELVNLRLIGTPLQYILGYQYFLGNKFIVNPNVLIPRADTEILVYETLKRVGNIKNVKILDMCTGSGCIAISLAKAITNSNVCAIDIDENALAVAKKNNELNETNVTFYKSNLFKELSLNKFDIIVSNPPYIGSEEMMILAKDVLNEPRLALFGGDDGLYFYREISKSAIEYLKENGYIIFEIGYNQKDEVSNILEENNYHDIEVIKDYSGNDRVVVARKQ